MRTLNTTEEQQVGGGMWFVDGPQPPAQVFEFTLPNSPTETLTGWIQFLNCPQPLEGVCVEGDGWSSTSNTPDVFTGCDPQPEFEGDRWYAA